MQFMETETQMMKRDMRNSRIITYQGSTNQKYQLLLITLFAKNKKSTLLRFG